MNITSASLSDVDEALSCLVKAFAHDPITGFLLRDDLGYGNRLMQFFSLLMRARIELKMPVLVSRGAHGIHGATMGYTTVRSEWPIALAEEWVRFENSIPGLTDRMAIYDGVVDEFKPTAPHYYLGVIGTDPTTRGSGIGTQLLRSFCELSAGDPRSSGVYLETAQAANLRFYERAGFAEIGRGKLGDATLWCMYLPHDRR